MDKDVLNQVPRSIEMCFHTIFSVGLTVEFEKAREFFAQRKSKQKAQQCGGSKVEKNKNPNPMGKGQKVNSLKSRISKHKQKKKQPAAKVSTFKPAPTKVKEPGENHVSQSVSKDRMTNRRCIKCSEK